MPTCTPLGTSSSLISSNLAPAAIDAKLGPCYEADHAADSAMEITERLAYNGDDAVNLALYMGVRVVGWCRN